MPLPGEITPGRERRSLAAMAQRADDETGEKRFRKLQEQLDTLSGQFTTLQNTVTPATGSGFGEYLSVAIKAQTEPGNNTDVLATSVPHVYLAGFAAMEITATNSDTGAAHLQIEYWTGSTWQTIPGAALPIPGNATPAAKTDWIAVPDVVRGAGGVFMRARETTGDNANIEINSVHILFRRTGVTPSGV